MLGSLAQVAFAGFMAAFIGLARSFPDPPQSVPRWLALGLLFSLPAVIGALGATSGRRALLAAAAALSGAGTLMSFSGLTLVFVLPTLLFAAGALAAPPARRDGVSRQPIASKLAGAVVAVSVVALGIGAAVALLSTTEMVCWEAYRTPAGIEYRSAPPGGNGLTVSPDALGSGCNEGELSLRGAAAAVVLSLAAVLIAGFASRRRGSGSVNDSGPASGVSVESPRALR